MSTALLEALENMDLQDGRTIQMNVRGHRVIIQVLPNGDGGQPKASIPPMDPPIIEEFEELNLASPDWSPVGNGIPCQVTMGTLTFPDPPLIEVDEDGP